MSLPPNFIYLFSVLQYTWYFCIGKILTGSRKNRETSTYSQGSILLTVNQQQATTSFKIFYSISSVLPWFWCLFKTPGEKLKIYIFGRGNLHLGFSRLYYLIDSVCHFTN